MKSEGGFHGAFLILNALVCPEVGTERGVIFEMLLVLTSFSFNLRIKNSCSCRLHLQGPGSPSEPSSQASLGFPWTWQVLERKHLCVSPLLDTLQNKRLNDREIGFQAKSHFLPVARPLVSLLTAKVQIRR